MLSDFNFDSFDVSGAMDKISPEAMDRCKKMYRNLPEEPDWKNLGMIIVAWMEGYAALIEPIDAEIAAGIRRALETSPIKQAADYVQALSRVFELLVLEKMMTDES